MNIRTNHLQPITLAPAASQDERHGLREGTDQQIDLRRDEGLVGDEILERQLDRQQHRLREQVAQVPRSLVPCSMALLERVGQEHGRHARPLGLRHVADRFERQHAPVDAFVTERVDQQSREHILAHRPEADAHDEASLRNCGRCLAATETLLADCMEVRPDVRIQE